jgi:Protein of unknown function (DUF2637)
VIDGTIVVALLIVLAAKRAAARVGYPWTLAGLFSAASVAFNVAHAPDRPVARLVFAMAPVALVLTTHLLMQQASWRPPPPDRQAAPDPAASCPWWSSIRLRVHRPTGWPASSRRLSVPHLAPGDHSGRLGRTAHPRPSPYRSGPVDCGRGKPQGGRRTGGALLGELYTRPLRPPVPGIRRKPPRPARCLHHRRPNGGRRRGGRPVGEAAAAARPRRLVTAPRRRQDMRATQLTCRNTWGHEAFGTGRVGRRHAAFLHDLYVEHLDGEIATEAFRLGELVKRAREAGRRYFGLRCPGASDRP